MKARLQLCVAVLLITPAIHAAEISGEVFIVTKAHESIKLGLVTVQAFRPDEISAIVIETRKATRPEIDRLKNIQGPARTMESKISEANDLVIKHLRTNLISETFRLSVDATVLVKRIDHRLEYLQSAAPFFERLPRPIASAKTDSDGKFRISVPDNSEIVLGASTSRTVPNNTENYFWLIKVKPPSNLTLSNDNSCDALAADSVIQTNTVSGSLGSTDSFDKLRTDAEAIRDRAVAFATRMPGQNPAAIGTAVLKQPFTFIIGYKRVTLGPGSQFDLVSKNDSAVRVRYQNAEYEVPISIVDLK